MHSTAQVLDPDREEDQASTGPDSQLLATSLEPRTKVTDLLTVIELETEIYHLKEQLRGLESALSYKEEELYALEAEQARLVSKYKESQLRHEQNLRAIEDRNDLKVAALQDTIFKQKNTIQYLQNDLETAQAEAQKYQQELSTLKADHTELTGQSQELDRNYRQAQGELADLTARLETQTDQNSGLRYANLQKDQEVAQMKKMVRLVNQHMAQYNREKAGLIAKAKASQALERRLENILELYRYLRKLYAQTNDRNISLANEIDKLKSESVAYMLEASEASQAKMKLKKYYQNFDQEMAAKVRLIKSKERELAKANRRLKDYALRNKNLQEQTAKAITHSNAMQIKLEAEIVSQEVLKSAIETEFKAVGEILGTIASGNIESLKKWDHYLNHKDQNIKTITAMVEQIERIKDHCTHSEVALIESIQKYFQSDMEASSPSPPEDDDTLETKSLA